MECRKKIIKLTEEIKALKKNKIKINDLSNIKRFSYMVNSIL